jgi:RNA polymerase sigma-70 factor (ECF subfamily)
MENEDLSAEFVAHRHELFSFVYALVRNVQDSEDIVQEVWLRFSVALERGVGIEKPAQWSRGTAKNLILHYWRKKGNAAVLVDSELVDLVELAFSEGDDEWEKELWQIRREVLADCVQTLPDDSRRLIVLRYDQGNPIAKIAEMVERSEGSIMMALSRLRRLLQSCVDTKLKARGAA